MLWRNNQIFLEQMFGGDFMEPGEHASLAMTSKTVSFVQIKPVFCAASFV
jgi:hypothetical protein